jgi:hypothetical protein
MRPKERRDSGQNDLLRARLDQIVDLDHPLAKLAGSRTPITKLFCGEDFFRHKLTFDRSSLTRWRQRMGRRPIRARRLGRPIDRSRTSTRALSAPPRWPVRRRMSLGISRRLRAAWRESSALSSRTPPCVDITTRASAGIPTSMRGSRASAAVRARALFGPEPGG